eukprot:3199708-Lingulodinium_polyedra.AAC.1
MLTAVQRFGAFAPLRWHGTIGPRALGIGTLRRAYCLSLAALNACTSLSLEVAPSAAARYWPPTRPPIPTH